MRKPQEILKEYLQGIEECEERAIKTKNIDDLHEIRIYKKQYYSAIKIIELFDTKMIIKSHVQI